jgi:ABC-type branched-subunit amino acid transport system substrate-binding protein
MKTAVCAASAAVAACTTLVACVLTATAAPPSKTPIKVMTISATNNPLYTYPELWDVAQAFAKMINAKGGINGHPLEVEQCDDQADPNLAVGCARQAVSDHVVALVGGISLYSTSIFPILEAAHIPWIGNVPLSAGDYTSPMSFPVSSQVLTFAGAGALEGHECKHPAGLDQATATSRALFDTFYLAGVRSQGKEPNVVYAPPSTTDYTSFVAQALSGGTDCLYVAASPTVQPVIWAAVQQSGQHVRGFDVPSTFTQASIDAAPQATEGIQLASANPLPTNSNGLAGYLAALQKYGYTGQVPVDATNDINDWVAFQIFAQISTRIKASINSGKLVGVLDQNRAVNTHSLTGPINFGKPGLIAGYPRVFSTYVTYWTVKNHQFVQTSPRFFDMTKNFVRGTH